MGRGKPSLSAYMEDALTMVSSQAKTSWKRTLRPGMKGQDVAVLQQLLTKLRYYTGECDGVYGILTKGAVFDFQKAHRLRVDGIAGKEVFSLLKSGLARGKLEHIVRRDETLSSIARKYDAPQELLVNANRLKTAEVEEGESLIIPVSRLVGFYSPEGPGEPVVPCERILPSLTAIAPRWFQLEVNGDISGAPDKNLMALASMTGTELWPVVTMGKSSDLKSNLLSDNTSYSAAAKGLLSLSARMRVRAKGLIISAGEVPEEDLYAFQSFLRKIRGVIKQEGLSLAVELYLPEEALLAQRQDYKSILKKLGDIASIAHWVFLTTHRDSLEFASPGPTISISRVKTALRSLTRIVDFWKLILVVPAFGVDFSAGFGAAPLRKKHRDVTEIIDVFKPVVTQPDGEESKVFKYRSFRVSHTVYFEDAHSIGAYAGLALRYGLAGIAIADIGEVDPWVWPTLKAKFKVVKGGGEG